jgi:hypothetical protein
MSSSRSWNNIGSAGICIDFAQQIGYRFVSINKRFGTKKAFPPMFYRSGQSD